jgi:hypothetical protein
MVRSVRVFTLKLNVKMVSFAGILRSSACADSGPDWARTSDPALIKRML